MDAGSRGLVPLLLVQLGLARHLLVLPRVVRGDPLQHQPRCLARLQVVEEEVRSGTGVVWDLDVF